MVELSVIMKMQDIIRKNNYNFNDKQMNEIHKGMQNDLDFFLYLNPKFSAEQMKLIRKGLEEGQDVKQYADPDLSYEEMLEIYENLKNPKTIEISSKKVEIEEEIIPEHIHDFTKTITMGNCYNKGLIKYKCKCGYQYEEITPEIHNYTSTTIMANCRQEGYTLYRCISCGHTYKDNFQPKTDHNFKYDIIQEATCRKTGTMACTCLDCGHTIEKEISMIGHKYEQKIIPATCIEEGYTLNSCIMCGSSYRSNPTKKIPHAFTNWERIKEPNCTEKGIEEQSCLRCKTKNTRFIEPTGHNYRITNVKPTCTEEGYNIYTCRTCKNTYNDDYVEKIPHDLTEWKIIKKPTTRVEGIRKRNCKCCSFVEEESVSKRTLTIESAQEEAMDAIKKKQTKTQSKFDQRTITEFTPILANYTQEEWDKYAKKFKKTPFDTRQELLIKEGLSQGLDVKIYAKPQYDYETMYELKIGVEHGIDLSKYAKDYDAQQINEIRLGIEHNVDYKKYLNFYLSGSQMREIRLTMEEGLDVNKMLIWIGCPAFLAGSIIGQKYEPRCTAGEMYQKRMELRKLKEEKKE